MDYEEFREKLQHIEQIEPPKLTKSNETYLITKDTFFLIDIPWRIDFYQGKGMTARSGTGITGGYIDRSSAQYLADLKKFLPIIKGPYIVTLPTHFSCRKTKGKMVFPGPYSKTLRSPKPFMFGNHASTVLFSNKPLKIQVPQITDFQVLKEKKVAKKEKKG